jgi:hypothetical protein
VPSRFDTPGHTLRAELANELEKRGYPYDELNVPFERYLAQALSGLTGEPVSELQTPVAALIVQARNLIRGGNATAATSPTDTALADIATHDGISFALTDGGTLQLVDGGQISLVGT